ncbi:MAG TPA: MFS transporter [Acidimicrobiales bacterium]
MNDEPGGAVPPAAPPGRLPGAYWRLWTASTVSNLGDGVNAAALPLLAATLTRDPRLIAGLSVAFTLPWLLFSLPAGAIVDRLDRRRVMWRVNVARGVLVGGIALVALVDDAPIWPLFVIALAIGVCETLFDNAAQAIMPAIVRPDLLETANGRQYAAETVSNQFVGPPVGSALFAVAVSAPFWLDSATFFFSALLIALLVGSFRPVAMPSPGEVPTGRRTIRGDVVEGLKWLRSHRLLRTLAVLLGVLNLTGAMANSTFVLFALEELGVSERTFGLLLAGMAVGGVVGGLVGGRIARALGQSRALLVAATVPAAVSIAVGIAAEPISTMVLMSITGVFVVVWNIITVSLRQQVIPDELFGRVNSVYRFFGTGMMPIGALAGGFLAEWFGLRTPWIVSGLVAVVAIAIAAPVLTQRNIDAARAVAPNRI